MTSARGYGHASFVLLETSKARMTRTCCRTLQSLKISLPTRRCAFYAALAVNFDSVGNYINPQRADLSFVQLERDRLVCATSRQNTVLVSVGGVASCNLIQPGFGGTGNTYQVKKIAIWGIDGEFQRQVFYIGNAYGHDMYSAALANGALTYTTKREGLTFGNNANSTPKKNAKFFKKTEGSYSTREQSFPQVLNFTDPVPVYDARRKPFYYMQHDFANLRSMPLYKQGHADLPPLAIVSVGYTVGTYTVGGGSAAPDVSSQASSSAANHAVSFNVLFVILHGFLDSDEPAPIKTAFDKCSSRK
ncbi:hypothetical protein NLJ89_g11778 [Agrocybe chaxingu]|uniref:Uncharacterized protein n=1 Tax=Agrocybe chaxingu TaxID=84603 RepID=A0A9W8JN42_9AGAR|nr:hypothetical protein NLJ89_g11778 [Agrocybe chaxingu]